jgi:raffinose/stachyose/melibiose transport system substrate-binding protein
MKRLLYTMASVLLVAMLAAGCGSSGGGGEAGGSSQASYNSSPGAEKVKLTLWVLNSGWEWVDQAVEDFKQIDPNIEVEVTHYETDPIKEALKVAASSRTLPDMWFTWGGSLGSFYPENGLTLDLTQVAKDHNWSEKYNKTAIEMSTYGGKVSGIPLHLNVLGMWYPKSVFEQAKLTPPKTFAEFEASLETLKKSGVIPLAFGSKGGWHTMRLTEQLLEHFAGPELHDKLNNLEASWNDPAVVKTFEKLGEYTDKGYFPKGYSSLDPTEAENLIYSKQAGMISEGTWFDGSIANEGFNNTEFEVFKFPTEQSPARSSVFAEMIQLNGELQGAKKDAAIKFGEYITGVEVANKYVETFGSPAVLDTTPSPNTPHLQTLLDYANDGGFLITDQALPQEVVQKLFEAQDKVAFKEWTPQQAAEEMEKAAAAYKAKNK